MCERYVLPDQLAAEREFLPATAWWRFAPRFNVAATQYVPAVRLHERRSEGVMLRWGFIPSWLEHEPTGPILATVNRDQIQSSAAYRAPWLNAQRCILPLAGFYAWHLTAENYRQPYFVRLNDRAVFGVAAIWDRWVSDEDDVIESCSIISLPPHGVMAEFDTTARGMPAILRRKDYAAWLGGTPGEANAALRPYNSGWLQAYPVSPRINSFAADDPELIRAAS